MVCGRLVKPMRRPFSFDEGAYKGRNVGLWEKSWGGGKNTRVKGGCSDTDIDSVITWDALMTRDLNEGDVVVVFFGVWM